ncbi:MAG TPA: hypothetical protein VF039_08965 [Longimicrobiales bacterium]
MSESSRETGFLGGILKDGGWLWIAAELIALALVALIWFTRR